MVAPKLWRRLAQYYCLVGKRCRACGCMMFPPRDVCMECDSQDLEDYRFKGDGEILTYTVIRAPFSDPESEEPFTPAYEPPYVLAIIKLKEGPQLTAQVVDCSPGDVKIGMPVKMVFRKIQEHGKHGVIQYGYKFRLV